jgi:hypothetical protein
MTPLRIVAVLADGIHVGVLWRLRHEVVIPPGRSGRPGERFLAPGDSTHPPWPELPGGSYGDFQIRLGRRGSFLTGVCFGTVADRGDPERHAVRAMSIAADAGSRITHFGLSEVAGEDACVYRRHFPRSVLVEWTFAHDGWLFGTGAVIRKREDVRLWIRRVSEIHASWTWIDAPARSA